MVGRGVLSQWGEGKKKKGNFAPVHAMKKYRGQGVEIHSFLTPVLDGQPSTSRYGRFTSWKEPQYPLNRRMGWTKSRSERYSRDSNPVSPIS